MTIGLIKQMLLISYIFAHFRFYGETMEKIKVFSGLNSRELERDVNSWLESNCGITITSRLVTATSQLHGGTHPEMCVVVTVFYIPKKS